MKGKTVLMIKRWWLTAVVFTCALSLTSCSKKKPGNELLSAEPGYTQCAGTIGDFDIWLYASDKHVGMYELYVIPYQLDAAGDIASITVANSSLAYKQLVTQVVLNPDQTIFAGYLTEQEVENYNIIAITPYDPTTNFASSVSEKDAFCEYNLPVALTGTAQ